MIRIFLPLILLLLLCSCNDEGCIEPYPMDNSVREQRKKIIVRANGNYKQSKCSTDSSKPESSDCGQWLNSGVIVSKDDDVKIEVEGKIYTCMEPWSISYSSQSVNYDNQTRNIDLQVVNAEVEYAIDARNMFWTNTATNGKTVRINKGDDIVVTVGKPNPNASGIDRNLYAWCEDSKSPYCQNKQYGEGLFALVTNDTNIIDAKKNSNPRYTIPNTKGNTPGVISTDANNGSDSATISVSSTASGILHFGLYDTGNEDYKNNTGGCRIKVSAYKCPSINGNPNPTFSQGSLLAVIDSKVPSSNSNNLSINNSTKANADGSIWLKVNDSFYGDNIGFYEVTIRTTGKNLGAYSSVVGIIMNFIQDKFMSNAIKLVKNILGGEIYISILQKMLILYIILYAIFFLMGMVEINQTDLVIRLFKMSIIFAFMSKSSWSFFYSCFFRLLGVVDSAADASEGFKGTGTVYYLIDVMTGNNGSNSNPFTFVDVAMQAMLLDPDAWYRILTSLFIDITGIFYFIGVLYSVFTFLKAVLKITISYIASFTYTAIMTILAPIFIPCFLFSFTRTVYETWLQYMFRYLMEPVLLITGLSLIANMMLISIQYIFNEAVCWKCAIQLSIKPLLGFAGSSLPDSITNIACIKFYLPFGYDNSDGGYSSSSYFLPKLPHVLFLMILVKFLENYTSLIDAILTRITRTEQQAVRHQLYDHNRDSSLGGSMISSITEIVKTPFGYGSSSRQRRNFNAQVRQAEREQRKDPGAK